MLLNAILILLAMLTALQVMNQEAPGARDEPVTLAFRHVVFDMTDSLASFTEMLVIENSGSTSYAGAPGIGGMEIPLPEGFCDLTTSWDDGGWKPDTAGHGIIYTLPVPPGMTRLALSYNLEVSDGLVEFKERVAHPTIRYVFVTSNNRVTLESAVLAEQESIQSGQREVNGLSGSDLAPGSMVFISARLSNGDKNQGLVLLPVLLSVVAGFIVIYGTARLARGLSVGGARIERLRRRRNLLVLELEGAGHSEKRLLEERLAATERLLDMIAEIKKSGTGSR